MVSMKPSLENTCTLLFFPVFKSSRITSTFPQFFSPGEKNYESE
jgi:hypothetical protein